ncbi:MAG TPA: ChbG/HpnK family deacetylase [Bryobacteraceae bacterium]|nr:ChbG/HpnK family deacetylase [Bryobacteraceae bacterium]
MPGAAIRLIVNADDFGFTRDVNAGIIEAHRNGILTATTLMANGAAFDDALALARANPSLDVGCHVVLVQGQSVQDPGRKLPETTGQLIAVLAKGEIRVYDEIVAQLRKIMCAGIRVTHLDTHKHTHLLPPVLDALTRAARQFGIPWVRKPFDFEPEAGISIARSAISVGVRALQPFFASRMKSLKTTDHFTGFQITGVLDSASLGRTLLRLRPGLTELMCHPGRLTSELRAAPTRLKESREIELSALIDPGIRGIIEQRGIELVNYRQVNSD